MKHILHKIFTLSTLVLAAMVLVNTSSQAQVRTTLVLGNDDGTVVFSVAQANVNRLLQTMNTAFAADDQAPAWPGALTANAKVRMTELWSTAPFHCTEISITENLLKLPTGGWQVRNIPVAIKEADPGKREEGVVNLTADGRIDDFYFGIEKNRYKSLISQGVTLSDFRRRQIILDFLENFRTAYNRKDLELIGQAFSDNALIIMGRVLQNRPEGPRYLNSLGEKRVELIRMNKQQYLTHLQTSFTRNKFIDVRFDDIEIVQHPVHDKIYGVNLRQAWRSTTYGDDGYLFLMIDFEDENRPIIHVRSWQPKKETAREEIISMGDFDIIK